MMILRFTLFLLSVPLTLVAGPYRVVAYRFGAVGNFGRGILTWAGIVLIFHDWLEAFSGESLTPIQNLAWIVLIAGGFIQSLATLVLCKQTQDPCESHCWAGPREDALAAALCILAGVACGAGGLIFFLIGFICSGLQITLARIGRRSLSWTTDDTKRLFWPICMKCMAVALPFFGPIGAMLSRSRAYLALARAWFGKRSQPAQAATGAKSPTFTARVMSHVVGHFIVMAITGAIGFRFLGNILMFVLAVPLWFMGWDVTPPEAVADRAKEVEQKAGEMLGEQAEKIRRQREIVSDRSEGGREELSEEVARRKRRAMWDFLTH